MGGLCSLRFGTDKESNDKSPKRAFFACGAAPASQSLGVRQPLKDSPKRPETIQVDPLFLPTFILYV